MDSADDASMRFKFRPSKRKGLRQRSNSDEQDEPAAATPGSRTSTTVATTNTNTTTTTTARRRLRAGVSFGTVGHGPTARGNEDEFDDDDEGEDILVQGLPDRFMHQTGLLTTLDDRHMNEYIESRLSSRRPPEESSLRPDLATPFSIARSASDRMAEQPTQRGKLFEVDVPLDLRRDDEATRRKSAASSSSKTSALPPWPLPTMPSSSRRRPRRGSDDMKRDQMVDEFLHENKLDVYDVAAPQTSSSAPGDNRSADDRMAYEFRQRYYSEVAARRHRKRLIMPVRQQKQPTKKILKGPKLGGSRNQRAAVREMLLKEEKEKSAARRI